MVGSISTLNLHNIDLRQMKTPLMVEVTNDSGLKREKLDISTAKPRELPPGMYIEHHPIARYTNAQMEMRPTDRADAALMSVVDPENFQKFIDAISRQDGDWRSILSPFSQQVSQHPEWLSDEYRLPAAKILRDTNYFMDLSLLLA